MKTERILLRPLTLFIGIGAVVGAMMMWIDPSGQSWGGEQLLEPLRYKLPWLSVFFKDFIPSGFLLLVVNGLPQLIAAFLLFKKRRYAPHAVLACGIILMLWIVLEWLIWGFNAMSNIYFVIGLVESVAAVICIKRT